MSECADILFELGTEELPPVALKKLSDALTEAFMEGLKNANISFGNIKSFASPRRLGLVIHDCDSHQPDQDIEKKGPAIQAAFDKDGNPSKAALGFARSCKTEFDQLQRLKNEKGEWLVYRFQQKGQTVTDLLPGIASQALDKLPVPKKMHWGNSNTLFVRPVHWLLFLYGNEIVQCEILGIKAGNLTYGHRFHHPDAITVNQSDDYEKQLMEKAYVIPDFLTRKQRISQQVASLANQLEGVTENDDNLLDEVTALVEWPVAIAGNFDREFLEVPHETLIYTMKKNQKYFPVFDSSGKLINHFITIANIESLDPAVIQDGNERVIRPRLADAKFFWEQDASKPLSEYLPQLKEVIFQKQLGSLADKTDRVEKLAEFIAELINADCKLVKRAARLSRCDLLTETVNEFPEMQGIMGRYQAGRDNEDPEVCLALDEFYMPRFSGDKLPESMTGVCIALADRIDTLTGIFGINQKPSGTKDPFALRRATLGIIRILRHHSLTVSFSDLIDKSCSLLGEKVINDKTKTEVNTYFYERLKSELIEQGISVELFTSVRNVHPQNLPDFDLRLNAVQTFSQLEQAGSLASANKRINNLLKKSSEEIPDTVDQSLFELDAEAALFSAVQTLKPQLQKLIEQHDYEAVLKTLSSLQTQVDDYFDQVMIMVDNEAVKRNRLALLKQISKQFLMVADISVLKEN